MNNLTNNSAKTAQSKILVLGATGGTGRRGQKFDPETTSRFTEAIKKLPQVVECHLMAGECDALLRIVTTDLSSYRRFHAEQLTRLRSVQSVKTEVPMETVKMTSEITLQ